MEVHFAMDIRSNIQKSKVLFEKSLEKIPGGVNSPVRAFGSVGGSPLFIKMRKHPIFMMLMAMNLLIMYVRGDPEYSGMHIHRL